MTSSARQLTRATLGSRTGWSSNSSPRRSGATAVTQPLSSQEALREADVSGHSSGRGGRTNGSARLRCIWNVAVRRPPVGPRGGLRPDRDRFGGFCPRTALRKRHRAKPLHSGSMKRSVARLPRCRVQSGKGRDCTASRNAGFCRRSRRESSLAARAFWRSRRRKYTCESSRVGLRMPGLEPNRFFEGVDCLRPSLGTHQGTGHGDARGHVVSPQGDRLAERFQRFLVAGLLHQPVPVKEVRLLVVGVEFDGLPQKGQRLVEPSVPSASATRTRSSPVPRADTVSMPSTRSPGRHPGLLASLQA